MSLRSLANLHCINCGEQTLHRSNHCIRCDTVSVASGNPPVPRAYSLDETSLTIHKGQHDHAKAEAGQARRRARQARHQLQRGRT